MAEIDFNAQVLAALDRLNNKIDDIREAISQQKAEVATLDARQLAHHEQQERFWSQATAQEERTRAVETLVATTATRQTIYTGIAAVICSAIVSGGFGFLFHLSKR
jgi:hypothetical protein